MKSNETQNRFSKRIPPYIIVSITGVIVVITITVLENNKKNPDLLTLWQNILLGISCSVVASVVFILFQRAFAREEDREFGKQLDVIEDNLKQQNELYNSGILSIHPKTHFDKEDEFWKNIISHTEHHLDLIGHSLESWFKGECLDVFREKILELSEQEKEVRILLSAERFDFQNVEKVYLNHADANLLNETEKTVLYFCRLTDQIEENKKQFLKVYVADLAEATYLYIGTEHQCMVSPYIFNPINSQNSFWLELQAGVEYARMLEDNFNSAVNGAKHIDLLLKTVDFVKRTKADERDRILEKKNQLIEEQNNKIDAYKKLLKDENITPVHYYLIHKDNYDNFKTVLKILECVLEVELIRNKKNPQKYDHKFTWRLVVMNPAPEPAKIVRFVYSGLKNKDVQLNILINKKKCEQYSKKPEYEVLGDDRFVEFNLNEKLQTDSVDIYIEYVLSYNLNQMYDRIWLVPDALGFADMDMFCIRFYSDGNIIHKETRVELKSYKLNKAYKLENEDESRIVFKDFENGKQGFEAKNSNKDKMHGYGYLLELIND